jgi:outer membrane receptor protein involved in Fe transport
MRATTWDSRGGRGARWLTACVAGLTTTVAMAQSETPAQQTLEEVVVTATKREESILKIPVSVSAVDAAQIDKLGAKDLEDLARAVPSLVVMQESEQNGKTFVIRGISSGSEVATVSVYVDDTPVTFGPNSPDLKLFDLERVEVLRGPQGTLFGSSSMGGAIRYVSPQPDFDGFSGFTRLEAGAIEGGGESYEAQAAGGGPLAERVAFRGSFFGRHDGGYIDLVDEDTGAMRDRDANSGDSYGGRLALTARFTDRFSANLSVLYQNQELDLLPIFFTGRGVGDTVPLPPLQRVDRVDVFRKESIALPNLTFSVDFGFARLTASSSYVDRHIDLQSDFSYFVQSALGFPDDLGRALAVPSRQDFRFRGFTEEVRLASPGDQPFEWLLAGYYQDTNEPLSQTVFSNLGDVFPPFEPLLLPDGVVFVNHTTVKRRQTAAFGEASYRFLDGLKVTAGLRVSDLSLREDRSADGLFNGGPSTQNSHADENGIVTPKFSVSYDVGEHAMIYATAAKGFRQGGANSPVPVGLPACAAALAALGLTDAPASFESDTLWSYEAGLKGRSAGNGVTYQLAAYSIDWSGIQQTINLSGGCGFSYIDNVGKARSRGVELETSWRPREHVTLGLNAGYTDAELTEDLISGADASGPIVAATKGTTLPDVPDWSLGARAELDFSLGSWPAFLRGDYQYLGSSKRHLGTPSDDPRTIDRDSYGVVGVQLGASVSDYELVLAVKNLLDEDVVLFETYQEFAPGTAAERTTLQPRLIFFSVTRRF